MRERRRMMNSEMEKEVRKIVEFCYFFEGRERVWERFNLVKQMCYTREIKEILRVVKEELKKMEGKE